MFTSIGGTAHSMSRRTMEKLRTGRQLRVVADRPVVDEALDQVAQAALKNSVERPQQTKL
jgi:TusA-related sulfurtransferase